MIQNDSKDLGVGDSIISLLRYRIKSDFNACKQSYGVDWIKSKSFINLDKALNCIQCVYLHGHRRDNAYKYVDRHT